MTGIDSVAVRQPRVRDRGTATNAADRIRFTPAILPAYARHSKSLEVLIPIPYRKGISTGDFEEALSALHGKGAPGLSASTIKDAWVNEHEHWRKRDLSAQPLEDEKQCILVMIGATPEGKKEVHARAARLARAAARLEAPGTDKAPKLAAADGALGFWKALGEI